MEDVRMHNGRIDRIDKKEKGNPRLWEKGEDFCHVWS